MSLRLGEVGKGRDLSSKILRLTLALNLGLSASPSKGSVRQKVQETDQNYGPFLDPSYNTAPSGRIKIMVPFWILLIIQHLVLRGPKRGP